jgi:glucosamine--fructose-6-phosphate aminotransferase (isomerizing)
MELLRIMLFKSRVDQERVCFHSDTDTEVLINLIEEVQKKENIKLGKAVQIALNQVVGLCYCCIR